MGARPSQAPAKGPWGCPRLVPGWLSALKPQVLPGGSRGWAPPEEEPAFGVETGIVGRGPEHLVGLGWLLLAPCSQGAQKGFSGGREGGRKGGWAEVDRTEQAVRTLNAGTC